ncbi:MAG: hypothetical protein IPM36_12350 [Lewinellaceae bacterium]|nr:hypothetical protein [Lewinellaceae bacterium]
MTTTKPLPTIRNWSTAACGGITDIMRHDIFTPPQASRIYAYSAVAAYEALIPGHPEYQSLAGQLNGLTESPKPEEGAVYCYPLASVTALMKVGKT